MTQVSQPLVPDDSGRDSGSVGSNTGPGRNSDLSRGALDRELVQRAIAREPEAVEEFVGRMLCVPRILHSLNRRYGRMLKDVELEDIGQDVLAVLWSKLDQFDGRAEIEAWAYRFCVFEFLKGLRKQRTERRGMEIVAEERQAASLSGADAEVQLERIDEIMEWIDRLDPMEAEAVRLRQFEELEFDEGGRRLGIPTNTFKSRYYRGIRELRRAFAERSPKKARTPSDRETGGGAS